MKKRVKGIHLSWIVVNDIEAAVKFYTETLGLTLHTIDKQFGWAELSGPDGATLGVSQANPDYDLIAGTNAVVTITVDDLLEAKSDYLKKGGKTVGEMMEIPGHVKLQTIQDIDGNTLQLVQTLSE